MCGGVVSNSKQIITPATIGQPQSQFISVPSNPDLAPELPTRFIDELSGHSNPIGHLIHQQLSACQLMPDFTVNAAMENEPAEASAVWELFDIQPTLDWLDADFLFMDNS